MKCFVDGLKGATITCIGFISRQNLKMCSMWDRKGRNFWIKHLDICRGQNHVINSSNKTKVERLYAVGPTNIDLFVLFVTSASNEASGCGLVFKKGGNTPFTRCSNRDLQITCLATSRRQATPCSKLGKTTEPYFWYSGMGRIFMVTSVTTPRVPALGWTDTNGALCELTITRGGRLHLKSFSFRKCSRQIKTKQTERTLEGTSCA